MKTRAKHRPPPPRHRAEAPFFGKAGEAAHQRDAEMQPFFHFPVPTAAPLIQREPDAGSPNPGMTVTPLPPAPLPQFDSDMYFEFKPDFDAVYTPVAPAPKTGKLEIEHRVHYKYKGKFSEDEQEKFAADFKKSVESSWSFKHLLRLKQPNFSEYQCQVAVVVTEVKDPARAHTRITVEKGAAKKGKRSFVSSQVPDKPGETTHTASLDAEDPKTEQRDAEFGEIVRQVGDFDHDSAELNTDVLADIQEVENTIRPLKSQSQNDTLLGSDWAMDLHGRATSVGNKEYNKRLAKRRAEAVELKIYQDFGRTLNGSRADAKGEENATNDPKFRRVDVKVWNVKRVFDPSTPTQMDRSTAAHEAGHMFGFGDEYVEEDTKEFLPKFEGDKPSHYDDVSRIMGQEAADELLVQDSDSIMSKGNTVRRGHYAYFVEALRDATGQNWEVV